jgi:hypothetical protein
MTSEGPRTQKSTPLPRLGDLGNTDSAKGLQKFECHNSVRMINELYHLYELADARRWRQLGREEITAGCERLTGVASSSRRKLSAEQDSRIGRTSSYERVSPRLTIPAARERI